MTQKVDRKDSELEKENAELRAQLNIYSNLNSSLYSRAADTSDEIDLGELWNAIWSGKWIIGGISFVSAIVFLLYALNVPNEYKSSVLLAPATSSSTSSLSKLAGQFGGLASLAGINLGNGADDKSVVALEIIKTWGFLEKFISDKNIQIELFAVKAWDRSHNKLVIDPTIYDVENKKWVRDFNPDKGQRAEPSSWELFEKLEERIRISQDKTSGLIKLSVEYYSPIIAKEWTDELVVAINAHIQKQDREEAIRSIKYLNEKIKETNIAEMHSVFYQLIEEQTKNLMLAEVSDEYVFKTLSPAKVSEEKTKPKRGLMIFLGFVLGGMLSIVIVVIKYFRLNSKKN